MTTNHTSIRCPQCRALNAERDARFSPPRKYPSAAQVTDAMVDAAMREAQKHPPFSLSISGMRVAIEAALAARDSVVIITGQTLERLKDKIDTQLNNCLCEMKEGYDDSITGFNEAWDIIRKIFDEALAALEPVDAGELIQRLKNDENLDDLDEAISALEEQAKKIQWLRIERDGMTDACSALKIERDELIEALKPFARDLPYHDYLPEEIHARAVLEKMGVATT